MNYKRKGTKKDLTWRNDALRAWLKQHDLMNIAALCRRINYDRGAFAHFIEGNQGLGEDAIEKVETTLSNYGYKI